ncbi:hypothetical protein AB1Y20_008753 [Prymnesium parvum]|uniref:Nucleotide-diphospho-sugar transferase domain-containing protein n=1 Tax=Prymnesium parvum TaxID=97485 RepID=A0AB34IUC0_PRYPA
MPPAPPPLAHDELPPADLRTLTRAARASADGRTVALVFATSDFTELVLNWCAFALRAGVRWFVVVALDVPLHAALSSRGEGHVLLLPRVRRAGAPPSKLAVIGERQRFGVRVLEAGLAVLHSDADALWLRDPTRLLGGAELVAERVWGKPRSAVQAWGAAACTGFYFVRPAAVGIAQQVEAAIRRKQASSPGWQASDQYWLNLVLQQSGATWEARMPAMDDMQARIFNHTPTRGVLVTPSGAVLRLVMLAHPTVARACPVISPASVAMLARGERLTAPGKARLWQALLDHSVVLHCFPPGGEARAGERRTVFMGHPKHTAAELAFQRRQGLWLLRSDWRQLRVAGEGDEARSKRRRGSFLRWVGQITNETVRGIPKG